MSLNIATSHQRNRHETSEVRTGLPESAASRGLEAHSCADRQKLISGLEDTVRNRSKVKAESKIHDDLPPGNGTEYEFINFDETTPAQLFSNTTLTDQFRPGDAYWLFQQNSMSQVSFRFTVPSACYPSLDTGTLYIGVNHACGSSTTVIDIYFNGKAYLTGFSDVPPNNFRQDIFAIPLTQVSLTSNEFTIVLSSKNLGSYWLSDVTFTYKAQDQTVITPWTSLHLNRQTPGFVYTDVVIDDSQRPGNPYMVFRSTQPVSQCSISFVVPAWASQLDGKLTVSLNHCTPNSGAINLFINDVSYRSGYVAPSSFTTEFFEIAFSSLKMDGQINTFRIELVANQFGTYWLSDSRLAFTSIFPELTYQNYDAYVKPWVLNNRRNIAELSRVPRDDLSAWQFIQNAPNWFLLPFLPCSAREIGYLIEYYDVAFVVVAFELEVIHQMARDFHTEFRYSDNPRKNAMRHAYWTALMTRQYYGLFAVVMSDAHEDDHIDLTIVGPFDHVTDRINNAIGIELAINNPNTDCATLVDQAWEAGYLATVREVKGQGQSLTADVYWSVPLKYLAEAYGVSPDFSDLDLATLQRMGVTVPDYPRIYDALNLARLEITPIIDTTKL